MNTFSKVSIAALILLPLACSGESGDPDPSGTGGAVAGTGGATTGGAPATGGTGTSTGGVGTGGTATGGVDGTGATAATGGASTGGAGTGGSDTGGTGGSVDTMTEPSPGCAKTTARPANGVVYKAGESWLIFPEKYDGTTPLPVIVGFHGCGSGNKGNAEKTEFKGQFDGSDIGDNYVRALPLSISDGGCYDQGGDMDRAKALFTNLVENYCVDLSRVYGVGHSYGAGFLMGMTGNKGNFDHFGFRGIAPVAGWEIASANVQVPTMYVQGTMDAERDGGDGANVAARVATVNGCNMDSTPYPTDACNSQSDGAAVTSGCKLYNECDEPTMWCRHNDKHYGTSYHGIPCFFNDTAYEFFESL